MRCVVERVRYEGFKIEDRHQYSLVPIILIITVTAGVYPQPWLKNTILPMHYHDPAGNDYPYPYPLNYVLLIAAVLLSALKIISGLCLNSIHNHPRAKRICRIY